MTHRHHKISIVTPSLNQGRFLEECIDSVLSQNYPNLEYIIVDGGSSDDSLRIIKKYQQYLSYWQSRPEGGQYAALQEGLRRSTGEIMGWLNSDDMLHPGGLFILDDVFRQMPEAEAVTGRRVGFNADGHLNSYGHERQSWSRSLLLDRGALEKLLPIMQEGTYWRRTLWDKAGATLDLSLSLAADFELWLRFSRFAQIRSVDALIGGFRSHGATQRSPSMPEEYLAQCRQAIDLELERFGERSASDSPASPVHYPVPASYCRRAEKVRPPKLSIVTPSYNQGAYLEECIDSVLSQNYPNLEYIIMDGGSSDNSVEIIKKYQKYLSYWQSAADGGQYAAVEEGFRRSTGEIMAWLNSDDKYHRNAFHKVAYAFSTFPHLQWIVGRQTFWDKNGDVSHVSPTLPLYGRGRFLQKNYSEPFIQQESTFWRRSLWKKAGGYLRRDLGYAGDLELWLRFFRFAELHTVDALLGGFRYQEDQKTALGMDRYAAEAEAVLEEEIELFKASAAACCSEPGRPLTLPADGVAAYIRAVCEGEAQAVDPDGGSDKVTACLLRQLEAQHAQLELLRNTLSWRITKPLRWLGRSGIR